MIPTSTNDSNIMETPRRRPGMNRDEEIDRSYIYGLKAGWDMGNSAGYIEGRMAYAILSDKQRQFITEELEEIYRVYQLCIENRMKFCREDNDDK